MDTDSTDKSASTSSHKLHQMRDDSGYKSLETQQSLGKSGIGVATASFLARIRTRSMDRAAPGLFSQPAATVGRIHCSLEAPSVPVQFSATTPKDILIPVPQLAVPEVKTTHHVDESATTTKSSSHSTLTEFFAGISSSTSQSMTDDPTQRKQHIPFVAEAAFLEKFAERTQTVGRALTSSFDRIRQQAGSFLSRTTAVVRGSSDVETPTSHPVIGRRASSSECQSTWTEKDSKLTVTPDPSHRRSTNGEVYTRGSQSQSTGSANPVDLQIISGGKSFYPSPVSPTPSRDPARDKTTFPSFAAVTGSKFVGPEAVLVTTPTPPPPTVAQSSRPDIRDTYKEVHAGSHQLSATETPRGSTHRQDRFGHGTKPSSSSAVQATSSSAHHAKQPLFIASETAATNPDIRRGNTKTASKRRREYRSKKQIQEVHHSGSLTETTQHQPGPVVPVHSYTAVVGEPSSSDNSLEQPSTNSSLERRSINNSLEQPSTNNNSLEQPSTSNNSLEQPSTDNSLEQLLTSNSLEQPSTNNSLEHPSTNNSPEHPLTHNSLEQPSINNSLEHPSTNNNSLEHPSTNNSLEHPSASNSLVHSSIHNSLEQPSTTSGGASGSGASDASSSCEVVTDLRPTRALSRDYSIDAKTDALFHEFVKYDPNLSVKRRTSLLHRKESLLSCHFLALYRLSTSSDVLLNCPPIQTYPANEALLISTMSSSCKITAIG